jgi:RIO-like serine/threonine protein kinase
MTCVTKGKGAPGKFEESGEVGERLYELAMDGCDDEVGSVQDLGWYGLLIGTGLQCAPHAIVCENIDGFFNFQDYDTEEEARRAWDDVLADYEDYYEQENWGG